MFIRKPPLGSGDAAKSQSSGYIHQFLEMYLYGLVVVLTAVLFRVHGEQFHCENGQLFCYWTRLAPSNWTTAYGDCTRSGGSLIFSQHSAYIEEWMSKMNTSISSGRVWSSLHRINHRFQLLHDQPAFVPIAASEWVPGHPLPRQWSEKRDCVVVNHRMLYESVDCNSSFAIICAISINRKSQLNNLVLPHGDLQVRLVIDPKAYEQRIVTNNLEIERNETNLMLKCKVTYHGSRKLEYSWIKDGVFMGNNDSALIPATVHDKSKTVSEDALYQKQGTYQCQVKEFGEVLATPSNAIIVTYRKVLNAVVSIFILKSAKKAMSIDAIMGQVRDFIHENVLEDHLKLSDFETSWDPLYSLPISPNEIEYRHSLYVDIVRQYPDGTFFHIMDVISDNVNNNQQLRSLSGAEKISVKWTTYCPKHNETITIPEIFQIFWPPSWVTPNLNPISEKLFCIQDNNRFESLTDRQCLPDFSEGASLTPLNLEKCKRVVTQPETRCRHGYQWLETTQVCFKVTENGSWHETMSACMNDWPTHDMLSVDYTTHHSVIAQYQQNEGTPQDMWLPVRRSSIYGPLLYYSSVNYGPEGISLPSTVERFTNLTTDEDECVLLTKNSNSEVVLCSTRAIPAVCVYRPRRGAEKVASNNLCSPPWFGYIIQGGQLTCFSLLQSVLPMNWEQAGLNCRYQHIGMAANVSMATFENAGKIHQWNAVRSSVYHTGTSQLKSAWIGLFWSESDGKFCWLNSEKNCAFQHFNWHPSANWTDGRFGIISNDTWDLLPSSEFRHHVLCQAVIDLSAIQNIRVSHTPDEFVQVQLMQDTHNYLNPMPNFFANLTELFSLGWRPWIFGVPPATEVGIQVNCYLDGEMIQTINLFPDGFSLRPNFSVAKVLHCESWVGWPRRFVRSEPVIVLRPDNSFVYVMMFDVLDGHGLQVDNQNYSINFRPDPLTDLSKRLERLGINGVTVQVTGHRWWNSNQTKSILVRAVITSRSNNQQNWPEIMKNAFLLQEENQLFYQLTHIRSAEVCEQETFTVQSKGTTELLNVTWNEVPIGIASESSNPCETVTGYPILRRCVGNPNTGAIWEPFNEEFLKSNNGSCRPATNLLTQLRKLTDDVTENNINASSALGRLSEIAETKWTGSPHSGPFGIEIGQAARLLHASVQRIPEPTVREFNDVSKTLTTMLASSQLGQAQFLSGVSNSLVESLEQVMGHVIIPNGQDSVVFQHPMMSTESILNPLHVVGYGANVAKNSLEVQNGSRILQNDSKTNLEEELVNRDIAIILPVEEIRKRQGLRRSDTSLRLSFSVFANGDLFDARPFTSIFTNEESTYVVDSAIIVAQVGNLIISNLTENVRIFFRSRSQHNQSVIPVCVFWDKSSSGGWSPFGCQYTGRNQDLYICECNHLTPLALLFPYFDKDKTIDERHRFALSLISVVGCVASMIGLSLVILTFFLFRKWRKSLGNKILFNFSLALFCVTGCFLCAGLVTFDHRVCKATAASMHYFLLASFAWMVVEGIYQYLQYVLVVGAQNYKSCFMRRASPLAWGLPVLPVLGIFIYDPDLYAIGDKFCWLELEAFYFTVLIPISIMLMFNIFIFIGVLKNVFCIQMRIDLRTSQSVKTRSWYQFRMAICIFFLLGLTWIFGFVSIGDARLVFAYLFCIFNSLQGFAIFAFFVLRERNARKLWFEFARMCSDTKIINSGKTPPNSRSSDYVLKPMSRY